MHGVTIYDALRCNGHSSDPRKRAWKAIRAARFNSFPVLEDGKVLGIVTKLDFLKTFAFTTGQILPQYDELMRRRVAEIMTEAVVHVDPSAPLTRVLQLMVSLKARSFPVIDPQGDLLGIISREDVMRALKWATT
jgi:CBS domain-containing protein